MDQNINIDFKGSTFLQKDKGNDLTKEQHDKLISLLHSLRKDIASRLNTPLDNIPVTIQLHPRSPHAMESCIGGTAYEYNQTKGAEQRYPVSLFCFINSLHDLESPALQAQIHRTFAHELHHAVRGDSQYGYGPTLGEAMISEGLAQRFEFEIAQSEQNKSIHPTFQPQDLVPSPALELQGRGLECFSERMLPKLCTYELTREKGVTITRNGEKITIRKKREGFAGDPRLMGRNPEYCKRKRQHLAYPFLCGYSLGYHIAASWLTLNNTTAAQEVACDPSPTLNWWKGLYPEYVALEKSRPSLNSRTTHGHQPTLLLPTSMNLG
ncbi:MAG: DUF2268 domain-containing putative Zn-dependent protease [Bdellovibrionales bacterium]